MVLKIAARQSDLARLQAFEVGRALERAAVSAGRVLKVEYAFRSSLGDQRADDPLWKMPEKGVFTEDFVADILAGNVDMVVHSWKDLPIQEREGSKIVATLSRADARDVLLVRRDRWEKYWATHRPHSAKPFRILTSSPRRVYNLAPFLKWALPWSSASASDSAAPEIEFVPVRGNIATRVGKLVNPSIDDSFDGLVVAKAALDRLLTSGQYGDDFVKSAASLREALSGVNFIVLPLSVNPSAAAQGALAIEVRSDRKDLIDLCRKIDAGSDRECVEAERRELARHGGGCHQKIGVTVLRRPYGTIEFVRGLTDAGVVLEGMTLQGADRHWPKPAGANEVFQTRLPASRVDIPHVPLESVALSKAGQARGYFVARADAWPRGASAGNAYLWTAGLSTWKKLAAQGVWVHGSTEGLGEDDDTRLEILAGREIEWLKLTHEEAPAASMASHKSLATYRVAIDIQGDESLRAKLQAARFFYWRSGSQFRAALELCPSIASGYHATGPGHTYSAVREALRTAGWNDSDLQSRLAIFLNESEFLKLIL